MGTGDGIALAGLAVLFSHSAWVLIGWSVLFGFFAPVGLKRNYALGVGLVTAMVMVLLDLALLHQGEDRPLLWTRLVDTSLSCIPALAGTALAYPEILKRSSPAPGRPGSG